MINVDAEQDKIVQGWRRLTEREVPVEIRIEVEDLLRNPFPEVSGGTLLYDRILRLTKYAQQKAASHIPSKRDSLVLVFRLLAMLINLLDADGFGPKVSSLTEELTRTTEREVPGHLEHITGDEFNSFFYRLTQFAPDIQPQELSAKIGVVIPAIVVASSRGALGPDAEALLFFKDEHVPLELLVEQMALLQKERREEYSLVKDHSYKSTMNALGYAIVKKYVRYPDNWDEVVRRLGCESTDTLRPLPISVKNALRQGGPNEWPEDAVAYAEALREVFQPLRDYAQAVYNTCGDDWDRVAAFIAKSIEGITALIDDIKPCNSCGGTGGDDEDCCQFCGGSGKQRDYRVPMV